MKKDLEGYIHSLKIFNYPNRIKAILNGERTYPITIAIHATNRCNCKCRYCNYTRIRDEATLSLDDWMTILPRLKAMNVKGINITGGGEPLLSPHIREVVECAKSLGFSLGLITNGILLDEYLDMLEEFKWVRVSVDSDNRQEYLKIRGVDQFDRVIENLKAAVKMKMDTSSDVTIGAHAVVVYENMGYLSSMAEFYRDIGIDYFQFRPEEQTKYTKEELFKVEAIFPYLQDLQTETFRIINSGYKWAKMRTRERSYSKCHAIDLIGTIDARGCWYVCCHWVGYPGMSYGNLAVESGVDWGRRKRAVQCDLDVNLCQIDCRGTMWNEVLERLMNPIHVEHI